MVKRQETSAKQEVNESPGVGVTSETVTSENPIPTMEQEQEVKEPQAEPKKESVDEKEPPKCHNHGKTVTQLVKENPTTAAAWGVLFVGLVYYAVKGVMADRKS